MMSAVQNAPNKGINRSKIAPLAWSRLVLLCLLFLEGVIACPDNSRDLTCQWSHCLDTYYTKPECKDHEDGYGCECGPGFYWNTHMCISSAVDSRFEFRSGEPIRYTLLLGKAFPALNSFTIAFWINVSDAEHPGTIFSYKVRTMGNLLRMTSGPKLKFEILGQEVLTDISLMSVSWYHIALTWNSTDGTWKLCINGVCSITGRIKWTGNDSFAIPSGGEFVLGQSSRTTAVFNSSLALDGDLSHLNIWNEALGDKQILDMNNSCTFMYCGNAVQWVEFRSGTRGAMKMRWPSGIRTGSYPCNNASSLAKSCETFCSTSIGARCNMEIKENIKWDRQETNRNVSVPCPTFSSQGDNSTILKNAIRFCMEARKYQGEWQDPIIDDCISPELLELKIRTKYIDNYGINEIELLKLAYQLLNHTEVNIYNNPVDIATVIDLLFILVRAQDIAPRTVTWKSEGNMFASVTNEIYPTFQQTKTFSELFINIVNNLLAPRNEAGWNATQPLGDEGDQLMQAMYEFADVISRSLDYHIKDGLVTYKAATIQIIREYVEFKIEMQWVYSQEALEFPDSSMLDSNGRPARESGFVKLPLETINAANATGATVFFGISTFRYKTLYRMLPSSNRAASNKEDRVNTPIVALYFHIQRLKDDKRIPAENLSSPIIISLPILDTKNISNPECVKLQHRGRTDWRWTRKNCTMTRYIKTNGICSCTSEGVYAITTDMYDDNWDKGDKRPKLMNFASYFGCAMSATLCLMVCGVHTYLRTSTSTAALHRNLSVSMALSQLVFMFGIDRYETPSICQVFAILLHYFFLATYSWVMNEAFNLYIVITYSTHNPSEQTNSGSMIRYYVLGWVLPAILVGAFVGTSDHYYAQDMCWVAPDHMWLFIGPAIGIISITILVLIFTAKEHNENSYTKSDKTNKVINIHMKALWTQVILVTVCWAFAFISIKIVDTILKYLYAMFTSLQGAFFVVFYMFLHEEVREYIKSRQKRRALQLQGFEYQDNHSLDSFASNSLIDKDTGDGHMSGTVGCGSGSVSTGSGFKLSDTGVKDARPSRLRELSRRKNRARIEASSDEGSDCEMISSV
ncbi:cadherin EGF LAG seven-pass G-type receptor 1-like [Physella acuta]|uniref:cadherin EGF LAG seven-pass G-type receptor 1-like n=1 Tax=Physella acuta TaxID=109671 RepID=UPI0027DC8427|nr:cadherin EGF LAG seven-pass G-type receptor 1-like [Physella acuta]XP_059158668.1 cadherin EGF LAG seven-pass G-type receptor 1-like [Physella acuta]